MITFEQEEKNINIELEIILKQLNKSEILTIYNKLENLNIRKEIHNRFNKLGFTKGSYNLFDKFTITLDENSIMISQRDDYKILKSINDNIGKYITDIRKYLDICEKGRQIEFYSITGIDKQTEKAILVIGGIAGGKAKWIPKSALQEYSNELGYIVFKGDSKWLRDKLLKEYSMFNTYPYVEPSGRYKENNDKIVWWINY